jgi:acetylornithine deacetylase/succinyl-diaminopimelate desuccinylase-like protein
MTSLEELLAATDAARDEIVALTQALVRIPSVSTGKMPTGDELPAAELLRDKLAADGIASEIYESAPNRGNLVARRNGNAGHPSLMMMGHIDVVPVEDAAQWTYPPFSAEVVDGRIWGRGAADMKGSVVASTMAMILLERAGVTYGGDLVLAICADEESGGAYGFDWLANNHPEVLKADYAINEGGGSPIEHDGKLTYPINLGEKGRYEVDFIVTGRGYHASAPWMADNAIMRAQPVLNRIAAYEPTVSTDAEMFAHIGSLLGLDHQVDSRTVDRDVAELMKSRPQLGSWLRAASRMTIVATMIQAGVKSNSVAETCTITCDVRTLPWQDRDYLANEIEHIIEGIGGVKYEIRTTAESTASPADEVFMAELGRATEIAVGRTGLEFIPGLTTGFTDSRLVRPLGVKAYGYHPNHPDSDASKNGAHNINESVAIEDVMVQTRFQVALVWNMLIAN